MLVQIGWLEMGWHGRSRSRRSRIVVGAAQTKGELDGWAKEIREGGGGEHP